MQMLVMPSSVRTLLVTETLYKPAQLEPIEIRGGSRIGEYALPLDVQNDPAFAFLRDVLDGLPVIDLNLEEAFPPEEV